MHYPPYKPITAMAHQPETVLNRQFIRPKFFFVMTTCLILITLFAASAVNAMSNEAWDGKSISNHGFKPDSIRTASNYVLSVKADGNQNRWIGANLTGLQANTSYQLLINNLTTSGTWRVNGYTTDITSNGSYQVTSDSKGYILIQNKGNQANASFKGTVNVIDESIVDEPELPGDYAWDGKSISNHGFKPDSIRTASNYVLSVKADGNQNRWIGANLTGLQANTSYQLLINNLTASGTWRVNGYTTDITSNGTYQVTSDSKGYILIQNKGNQANASFKGTLYVTDENVVIEPPKNDKNYPLPNYDVYAESISKITEFSASQSKINLDSDFHTQIATFEDNVYLVWIHADGRPRVATYNENNPSAAKTVYLDNNSDYKPRNGDAHHLYSIGIDRDGYIHIVGDMHHHPISNTDHLPARYKNSKSMYWVSDKPQDISSFSFRGNDPTRNLKSDGWSYTYFTYDNNMKLYMAGRMRGTYISGWSPGVISMGIETYDEQTKTWTALGASPAIQPRNKSIVWTQHGASNTGYQAMKTDVYFDLNNRMHISAAINADNSLNTNNGKVSRSMTHVVYAYSDDGGNTFNKADGTAVSLPIDAVSGSNQGTIVVERKWLGMLTSNGVMADGNTFVTYHDMNDNDRKLKILTGPSKGNEYSFRAAPVEWSFYSKQYVDKYGVINIASNNRLLRSQNPADSWRVYEGLNANHNFDRRLLAEKGEIRYSYQDKSRNTLGVAKLNITPPN